MHGQVGFNTREDREEQMKAKAQKLETEKAMFAISRYIRNEGGKRQDWYVGITCDLPERLFGFHGVQEGNQFIYVECSCDEVARTVEYYFTNILHCDGDTGGGNEGSNIVYAYRIAANTRER